MLYTVYKTTNKINGKIYIGVHKTKNLDDGYLGSGKHLGYAIEKYGVENFEKEILAIFDNKKDMFDMESELVNEDFIKDKSTYNLKLGGFGGFDFINENGLSKNNFENIEMHKKVYKLGNIKKEWLRKNDPEWVKSYSIKNSESKIKYFQNHDGTFKGKKHTEETKRKIGDANSKKQKGTKNSQFGTMWIHNLELKESKKIKKIDPIPEGWLIGRKIKF